MSTLTNQCINNLYRNNLIFIPNTSTDINICRYDTFINSGHISEIKNIEPFEIIILIKSSTWNIEHIELLKSILDACKLNPKNIALVNYVLFQFNQNDLQQMKDKYFLSFDVSSTELHLTIPIISYIEYKDPNRNIFLFSNSLSHLSKNIEDKKKIWNTLKKIFNL